MSYFNHNYNESYLTPNAGYLAPTSSSSDVPLRRQRSFTPSNPGSSQPGDIKVLVSPDEPLSPLRGDPFWEAQQTYRLADGRRMFFFDVDGTLDDQDRPVFPESLRKSLAKLCSHKKNVVSIISYGILSDIKKRVGYIPRLWICDRYGDHGYADDKTKREGTLLSPRTEKVRDLMEEWESQVGRKYCSVETRYDKKIEVVFKFRRANDARHFGPGYEKELWALVGRPDGYYSHCKPSKMVTVWRTSDYTFKTLHYATKSDDPTKKVYLPQPYRDVLRHARLHESNLPNMCLFNLHVAQLGHTDNHPGKIDYSNIEVSGGPPNLGTWLDVFAQMVDNNKSSSLNSEPDSEAGPPPRPSIVRGGYFPPPPGPSYPSHPSGGGYGYRQQQQPTPHYEPPMSSSQAQAYYGYQQHGPHGGLSHPDQYGGKIDPRVQRRPPFLVQRLFSATSSMESDASNPHVVGSRGESRVTVIDTRNVVCIISYGVLSFIKERLKGLKRLHIIDRLGVAGLGPNRAQEVAHGDGLQTVFQYATGRAVSHRIRNVVERMGESLGEHTPGLPFREGQPECFRTNEAPGYFTVVSRFEKSEGVAWILNSCPDIDWILAAGDGPAW
ncbi:trehalose 6-phosphate phosphatase [Pseudohyphozyma bogoriensis]|nr:trehalose 6-phosphate phosphatase [Pseudohyphozyma bogoriensis]